MVPITTTSLMYICDPILEDHPFGHMENLQKNSIENFTNFFDLFFLHIWIKQSLNFLAVKFHTYSFFLDKGSFIRPCSDFPSVKFVWDNN